MNNDSQIHQNKWITQNTNVGRLRLNDLKRSQDYLNIIILLLIIMSLMFIYLYFMATLLNIIQAKFDSAL